LVDADADEIGWQQIGSELNSLPRALERRRQRLGEAGLANTRDIFDEEVAFGEEAHNRQLDLRLFAVDHLGDVVDDRAEQRGERRGRGGGCSRHPRKGRRLRRTIVVSAGTVAQWIRCT
jgi:hypothetical protein